MKKAITQIAFALAGCITGSANAGDLTILIQNVKDADGRIRVALFNNAGEFPRGHTFKSLEQASAPGTVEVIFKNVPRGKYAIVAFQDKNGDGSLNKNIVGIPTEPLGFSNDVWITSGPPPFDGAKFSFDGANQVQAIRLR